MTKKKAEFPELDKVLEDIRKKYGEGSIMTFTEEPNIKVKVIPTGSIALDQAIGVGGVPKGRLVEIYGSEASGKTTLALSIIANAQNEGISTAYVDAEHAIDIDYAKRIGVDFTKLVISQPDSGEEALEIVDQLVREAKIGVVVVDSVAALVPRLEIESDIGKFQIAPQARIMGQALRKITSIAHKAGSVVIFINQLRHTIGMMGRQMYTTPGGKALKFHASLRLDLRSLGKIKKADTLIGNRVIVKVAKNKVGIPFKTAEFDIYYDSGISKEADLVHIGTELGILNKVGLTYYFGEKKLGGSLDISRLYLMEDKALADKIEKEVLKALET